MEFEFGLYEEFIYKRTYSRWLDDLNRRETFWESTERFRNFFNDIANPIKDEFNQAIEDFRSLKVVPSMRAFYTAGPALKENHIAAYNCAYTTIDNQRCFSEFLLILMHGTGIGFSVERQIINNLPEVPKLKEIDKTILFEDSKYGWAKGLQEFIDELYIGNICKYDLSMIRPKGSRLKIFGGRASGPDPLDLLLKHFERIFKKAEGRKLRSIEIHDLCCHIANAVVVGGVRRSSSISLSNLSDDRMKTAKDGEFWIHNPQRAMANNSVAYTEKPDMNLFINEWINLMKSGTGERGIFNREGCEKIIKKNGRRQIVENIGVNPCSEIILKPYEFCNLSEVILRVDDSLDEIKDKIKSAVVFGCLQATLTDFKYISSKYKENCEEERLLGVSLTGLRDHNVLKEVSKESRKWLKEMKKMAIDYSLEISKRLNINMPGAITTVKPSGTVSQMVNTSSGIHTRFSPYYIRRVRVTKSDSLCKFLIDKGVSYNPEVGENIENANTIVFDFPIESPKACICNRDVTAIDQLEYWKMLQTCWCEHKPSATIYVDENEWLEVGSWVYKNWDLVSGVSFLPKNDSVYQLAPYQEITSQEYNDLKKKMPRIDFNELDKFEKEDTTIGAKEFACSGGSCELI